jgi:hypothetical protein
MIAPSLEQQVAILHNRLNEAFERITQLEQEKRTFQDGGVASRSFLTQNSAEMACALQLCAELFPGSVTTVEWDSDPDDGSLAWCVLVIDWRGTVEESLRQQDIWHRRFAERYLEASRHYRLFVALA